MPSTYAGNPAIYPTSISIPSDGDGPGIKAADVNAGFEGLADRTANIKDLHETRLDALEARRDLVNYQRVAGADLLGFTLETGVVDFFVVDPLFTSGVATQVGDIVEVELSVGVSFTYASAAATATGLLAEMSANQNGGGYVAVTGTSRLYRRKPLTASGDTHNGTIHQLGSFVIATAGTLLVRSSWFISNNATAGNQATATNYAAALRIWRS